MSVQGVSVGSAQLTGETLQQVTNSRSMSLENVEYTYDKDAPIKSGADGTVYFAKSTSGDEVCIKEAKPQGVPSLKNESSALDVLGVHASIVSKKGFEEGSSRLALEKYDGALNDSELLQKTDLGTRGQWLAHVRDGVEHMHGVGIAHGDINSKNILHKDGRAVITDFGSAKDYRDTDEVMVSLTFEVDGFEETVQQPLSKGDAIQVDQEAYIQLAYNVLAGRGTDAAMPGKDEGVVQLGGLPDGARKLAEEVFFGTAGVAERYGKVPELLHALNAKGPTVEQHFGDMV